MLCCLPILRFWRAAFRPRCTPPAPTPPLQSYSAETMFESLSQYHGHEMRAGQLHRQMLEVDPMVNWCARMSMAGFACAASVFYFFLASDLFETGPKLYLIFKDQEENGYLCLYVAMTIGVVLYVFDSGYWEGRLATLRSLLYFSIVVLSVGFVWCSYGWYPAGPSFLYMWILFFYFAGLKTSVFVHSNMATFLDSLGYSFFGSSFVCIIRAQQLSTNTLTLFHNI